MGGGGLRFAEVKREFNKKIFAFRLTFSVISDIISYEVERGKRYSVFKALKRP